MLGDFCWAFILGEGIVDQHLCPNISQETYRNLKELFSLNFSLRSIEFLSKSTVPTLWYFRTWSNASRTTNLRGPGRRGRSSPEINWESWAKTTETRPVKSKTICEWSLCECSLWIVVLYTQWLSIIYTRWYLHTVTFSYMYINFLCILPMHWPCMMA